MYNNAVQSAEKLFINTLAFEFPQKPITFYFSLTEQKGVTLTKLSHQLFPTNIKEIFPDITNSHTLYTSFTRNVKGFTPLEIDFKTNNFALVKRFYNREIKHYFTSLNILVEPTFVKDNQVWLKATDATTKKIKDCTIYDRFTLKVNYNHFSNNPELVLSYDRQAKVYNKSVAKFLSEEVATSDDIFADTPTADNPANLLNRVVYVQYFSKDKKQRKQQILKYSKLCELSEQGEQINYDNVYPIVGYRLATYLGYEDEEASNTFEKKNRYKKYLPRIFNFRNKFLFDDDFRRIVPIAKEFTAVKAGTVKNESKRLIFGKNEIDLIPQRGINKGPYAQPRHNNIQLFFISPEMHKETANTLYKQFKDGYVQFKGLTQYLGIQFTSARGFSMSFNDFDNPIPEIEARLNECKFEQGVKYLAIYLTPIGKNTTDHAQRCVYYRVKELLLKWGIASQCIETDKMLTFLKDDEQRGKGNFAYTLQNIAIAINAKLGGTPWRIAVPQQRELIVGVGAFNNTVTNTKYIGSAFSFDNTGAFNSFEYFQKDELKELAGSIQNAIIDYANAIQNPQRLIIHYYKDMSEREVEVIEKTLYSLNIDIPIFVVTINKTESEDIIVFDDAFDGKMPYSGRFINLGKGQFLLCNNTRYEDNISRNIEGFPFPVKLKICCPTDEYLLNQNTIIELIEQVYQFSRIYWKSVRQQNLPVTIKYPEMVAEIAPHFSNGNIPSNIGKDNLWFL